MHSSSPWDSETGVGQKTCMNRPAAVRSSGVSPCAHHHLPSDLRQTRGGGGGRGTIPSSVMKRISKAPALLRRMLASLYLSQNTYSWMLLIQTRCFDLRASQRSGVGCAGTTDVEEKSSVRLASTDVYRRLQRCEKGVSHARTYRSQSRPDTVSAHRPIQQRVGASPWSGSLRER